MESSRCLKKDHPCSTRGNHCFINWSKTSAREKFPPSGAPAAETSKAKLEPSPSVHNCLSPLNYRDKGRKEFTKARGDWMGVKFGFSWIWPCHMVRWCPSLSPTSTSCPRLPSKCNPLPVPQKSSSLEETTRLSQGCKLHFSSICIPNRSACCLMEEH